MSKFENLSIKGFKSLTAKASGNTDKKVAFPPHSALIPCGRIGFDEDGNAIVKGVKHLGMQVYGSAATGFFLQLSNVKGYENPFGRGKGYMTKTAGTKAVVALGEDRLTGGRPDMEKILKGFLDLPKGEERNIWEEKVSLYNGAWEPSKGLPKGAKVDAEDIASYVSVGWQEDNLIVVFGYRKPSDPDVLNRDCVGFFVQKADLIAAFTDKKIGLRPYDSPEAFERYAMSMQSAYGVVVRPERKRGKQASTTL